MRRRLLLTLLCGALVALMIAPSGGAAGAATPSGAYGPIPPPAGPCYSPPFPTPLAPNQTAQLYGLAPLWAQGFTGKGRSIAILDPYEQPDLKTFEDAKHCFGATTSLNVQVVGPGNKPPASGEATLDSIITITAAPHLDDIWMFSGTDNLENNQLELLRRALDPANTGGKLVDAVSTSFTFCEASLLAGKPGFTADYPQLMDQLLHQAADLGVTVFADAADGGSANCAGWPQPANAPQVAQAAVGFPSSSPWTVSVGGTQLDVTRASDGSGTVTDEVVWNEPGPQPAAGRFGGGGGSSLIFDAPTWQQGVVPGTKRSLPDIAFMAGTPYWSGGGNGYWFGTSAATPFSAASWAIVQSALAAQGVTSPGFLAPLLYELARTGGAGVFRDITKGNNDLWGKVGCCTAGPGYDQASGLGSLQFHALATALGPATAALAATPTSGSTPLTVTLDASASATPGGTITSYAWDDDGNGTTDATTTTPTRTVTYSSSGTVTPSVTITTSLGRQAVASTSVVVAQPAAVPVAVVVPTFTG